MIPVTEPEETSDVAARKAPRLHLAYPEARSFALSPGSKGIALDRAFFEHTLRVANPTASSASHARIDQPNATIRIVEAGGKNGTWVNGARLAEGEAVTLSEGTVIRIGQAVFVYRESASHLNDPPETRSFAEISGRPTEHVFVGPFTLPGLARSIDQLRAGGGARKRVLIRGDTGTGKEAVARWIAHALRPKGEFVACNAARLTAGMGEAELYGYERGAFTGALGEKTGCFEQADGGTLFLDEIGDLLPTLQAGLLRPLESGQFERMGAGAKLRTVDVLVVAASAVLAERVASNDFRRDLMVRLEQAVVPIPPLAQRREDTGALVAHLLSLRTSPVAADAAAVEALMIHDWRGNVRELAAAVDEAARTSGKLTKASLPAYVRDTKARPSISFTRGAAELAYRDFGKNAQRTADHLGTTRPTLERILEAAREGSTK